MKTVILAGGVGSRISEETIHKPKPMVLIGDEPILWHIMQIYWHFGHGEFVIALGFQGSQIKDYFLNLRRRLSDMTVDLSADQLTVHDHRCPPWVVHLVDTGQGTMTGGRLARLRDRLDGERFMLTYGDGLASVDISALIRAHEQGGRLATMTTVCPPSRWGELSVEEDRVACFKEKPVKFAGWINGGFMVFEPEVFDYIDARDDLVLETEVIPALAADGQLTAYRHEGFWQPMDTLREKHLLDALWSKGQAPWLK